MEELYLAALNSGIGGLAQGEDNWDEGQESYRGFNSDDDLRGLLDDEEQERRAKRLNRKRRLAKKRKAEARWAA